MVELDPKIYGAAEVVAVDSLEAAREEAGDPWPHSMPGF
jgi:hypothetical protein